MKLKSLVLSISAVLLSGCGTMVKQQEYNADLIINNGQVLTVNADMQVINDGVVVVKNDKIIAVGDTTLLSQYYAPKNIDANDGIVMPGMINAHNHLPMIAFRGLGEEGISNRLFAYFFPLEAQKLSRELIYNATKLGAIDLAQSGVTTYADMYYHMDEMAKATKEVGLRAVLGETVIKFPVVDAKQPYGGIQYAQSFIEEYQNDPLITPAYAPHAVYTVSKEKLQEINQLSEDYDVPVLIHVAEFPNEETRIKDPTKAESPVEYLEEIGVLDERMVIAHGIHLSQHDQALLKQADAGVVYNPMANAKGATGIAPAWDMFRADMRVGLGTDGPMSSNQVDLWRTLSYAANMQRLKHSDRTIMIPEQVIEMATIGGAKALHMEDEIGSLEVGKKADIIIIETQSANMMPNYDPYATLVYQANPSNVETTIVNGKVVMEQRQMQTVQLDDIRQSVEAFESDIAGFAKELSKKAIKSKSLMD
ncbi:MULTISPECIES: amidohydrolase [Aliivibrio]|uniref:Amidohydrolase n=1 Tax=Aliivibrio finisterrensis TaxID=511998 RepID=A0A4Q5KVG1_9GAMM|nr:MULTISPECIES: amidohydrolase [Aliivibrio]MDD9178690.1 amidohydrolase [Aliivibrio sp. A6]RYU52474.1 amidohydrolase [Aliivibrio finisterrensis]RYU55130.1 amidohydrolase [Aliivibrio finisterrensis]RYU59789.1 amidohydrolase [Aliivibrio finisterrensis]RYU65654.1 amidohydrolase [Aliivibrio finisterrensis]